MFIMAMVRMWVSEISVRVVDKSKVTESIGKGDKVLALRYWRRALVKHVIPNI
jgi:hypothetical protein